MRFHLGLGFGLTLSHSLSRGQDQVLSRQLLPLLRHMQKPLEFILRHMPLVSFGFMYFDLSFPQDSLIPHIRDVEEIRVLHTTERQVEVSERVVEVVHSSFCIHSLFEVLEVGAQITADHALPNALSSEQQLVGGCQLGGVNATTKGLCKDVLEGNEARPYRGRHLLASTRRFFVFRQSPAILIPQKPFHLLFPLGFIRHQALITDMKPR